LFVGGLLSFIFVYPKLIYWSKFPVVSEFVYTYTGKRLLSGRDRIWEQLTELINKKPILGHGTGTIPEDVIGISLSSHNLYLQTALQNGYLGLSLLFILFFIVWKSFWHSRKEYSTRLSASFFIGILVYQSFEVVLTQNKMDTALMFWFIISIGVSNSINHVKSDACAPRNLDTNQTF